MISLALRFNVVSDLLLPTALAKVLAPASRMWQACRSSACSCERHASKRQWCTQSEASAHPSHARWPLHTY